MLCQILFVLFMVFFADVLGECKIARTPQCRVIF